MLLRFLEKKPKASQVELLVNCPHCAAPQRINRFTISTDCSVCGGHIKLEKGRVIQVKKRSISAPQSTKPLQPQKRLSEYIARFIGWQKLKGRFSPSQKEQKGEKRTVYCFSCGKEHRIIASANSTICPFCSSYVNLKDYVIEGAWSRPIQTQGSVHILKKAKVSGISIHCFHLRIEGEFQGSAEVFGEMHLLGKGDILGEVSCEKLFVEKKASVRFLRFIKSQEAVIKGRCEGDIHCAGKLTVLGKAILKGDIVVGSLVLKPGATHQGHLSIGFEHEKK